MKLLGKIKFGQAVFDRLVQGVLDKTPVTHDQIARSLGVAPKQLQKALADLCKEGYAEKTDRGYTLTQLGQQMMCLRNNGQETTT